MKDKELVLFILFLLFGGLHGFKPLNRGFLVSNQKYISREYFHDVRQPTRIHAARINAQLDQKLLPTMPYENIVIPKAITSKLSMLFNLGVIFVVALAAMNTFGLFMKWESENKLVLGIQNLCRKVEKKFKYDIIPFFTLGYRVMMAKLSLFTEKMRKNRKEDEGKAVDLTDWNICVLKDKQFLQGNYVKYRFTLPDPTEYLPLFPGQVLLLCTVDNNDQVLKEAYFPLTPVSTKGSFEILVQHGSQLLSSNEKFIRSLQKAEKGDELAFKSGKYKLNYQGADESISSMTIIGSGLGISAVLQIVRGILSDPDTTVKDIEFLWMNEDMTDFVFHEEIESLELKYIERFFTTNLMERDLFGLDLSRSEIVYEAISAYETGRLAIICGPDYICSKSREFLIRNDYPSDNVITIPMS